MKSIFINRERKLAKGDFAMLKKQYKGSFPDVPTRMALKVETIKDGIATVVFINYEANEICKQVVPVSALSSSL
ncbi:MAG: hypothetical protein M3040_02675 [Bacteroidota bacterium]|nr:hypothetical protein [Bacteroidota bacterium]